MSEKDWVTFSLRMKTVQQCQTLKSLATQRGLSMATLGRDFILDGISEALADPKEIERIINERKQELLAAAAEFRTQQP